MYQYHNPKHHPQSQIPQRSFQPPHTLLQRPAPAQTQTQFQPSSNVPNMNTNHSRNINPNHIQFSHSTLQQFANKALLQNRLKFQQQLQRNLQMQSQQTYYKQQPPQPSTARPVYILSHIPHALQAQVNQTQQSQAIPLQIQLLNAHNHHQQQTTNKYKFGNVFIPTISANVPLTVTRVSTATPLIISQPLMQSQTPPKEEQQRPSTDKASASPSKSNASAYYSSPLKTPQSHQNVRNSLQSPFNKQYILPYESKIIDGSCAMADIFNHFGSPFEKRSNEIYSKYGQNIYYENITLEKNKTSDINIDKNEENDERNDDPCNVLLLYETGEQLMFGAKMKSLRISLCKKCEISENTVYSTTVPYVHFQISEKCLKEKSLDFYHSKCFHFIICVPSVGTFEYCNKCLGNNGRSIENEMKEEQMKDLSCVESYLDLMNASSLVNIRQQIDCSESGNEEKEIDVENNLQSEILNKNERLDEIEVNFNLQQLIERAYDCGMSKKFVDEFIQCYEQNPIPNTMINFPPVQQIIAFEKCINISFEDAVHIHFIVYHPTVGVMEFCKKCDKIRSTICDNLGRFSDSMIHEMCSNINIPKHNQLSVKECLSKLIDSHIPTYSEKTHDSFYSPTTSFDEYNSMIENDFFNNRMSGLLRFSSLPENKSDSNSNPKLKSKKSKKLQTHHIFDNIHSYMDLNRKLNLPVPIPPQTSPNAHLLQSKPLSSSSSMYDSNNSYNRVCAKYSKNNKYHGMDDQYWNMNRMHSGHHSSYLRSSRKYRHNRKYLRQKGYRYKYHRHYGRHKRRKNFTTTNIVNLSSAFSAASVTSTDFDDYRGLSVPPLQPMLRANSASSADGSVYSYHSSSFSNSQPHSSLYPTSTNGVMLSQFLINNNNNMNFGPNQSFLTLPPSSQHRSMPTSPSLSHSSVPNYMTNVSPFMMYSTDTPLLLARNSLGTYPAHSFDGVERDGEGGGSVGSVSHPQLSLPDESGIIPHALSTHDDDQTSSEHPNIFPAVEILSKDCENLKRNVQLLKEFVTNQELKSLPQLLAEATMVQQTTTEVKPMASAIIDQSPTETETEPMNDKKQISNKTEINVAEGVNETAHNMLNTQSIIDISNVKSETINTADTDLPSKSTMDQKTMNALEHELLLIGCDIQNTNVLVNSNSQTNIKVGSDDIQKSSNNEHTLGQPQQPSVFNIHAQSSLPEFYSLALQQAARDGHLHSNAVVAAMNTRTIQNIALMQLQLHQQQYNNSLQQYYIQQQRIPQLIPLQILQQQILQQQQQQPRVINALGNTGNAHLVLQQNTSSNQSSSVSSSTNSQKADGRSNSNSVPIAVPFASYAQQTANNGTTFVPITPATTVTQQPLYYIATHNGNIAAHTHNHTNNYHVMAGASVGNYVGNESNANMMRMPQYAHQAQTSQIQQQQSLNTNINNIHTAHNNVYYSPPSQY